MKKYQENRMVRASKSRSSEWKSSKGYKQVTDFYLVISQSGSQKGLKTEVSAEEYAQYAEGDTVEAIFSIGGVTGSRNFMYLNPVSPRGSPSSKPSKK